VWENPAIKPFVGFWKGGIHAHFGNYGKQTDDPDATISSEEQQNIAVEVFNEFLARKE
jgi:hypothetical protein